MNPGSPTLVTVCSLCSPAQWLVCSAKTSVSAVRKRRWVLALPFISWLFIGGGGMLCFPVCKVLAVKNHLIFCPAYGLLHPHFCYLPPMKTPRFWSLQEHKVFGGFLPLHFTWYCSSTFINLLSQSPACCRSHTSPNIRAPM